MTTPDSTSTLGPICPTAAPISEAKANIRSERNLVNCRVDEGANVGVLPREDHSGL